MRLTLLFPILCALLLFGCDPKVNQRQARYDATDCPSCIEGKCTNCKATGKCAHCDEKGNRVTSTKNYTGEGVKLVDTPEPCPFCKATGTCSYCEGSGKCHACDGEGKSTDWEKKSGAKNDIPVSPVTAPTADSSAAPTDSSATADTAAAK